MIGYIEGKIVYKQENLFLLLVNGIGYEIILPMFVMKNLSDVPIGNVVSLYIYYHQTERQPKPVLIGFNSKKEKDFFREFVSTNAIGAIKAIKALNFSIGKIAGAIENSDIDTLKKLNGVGTKTAQKILVSLQGKMGRFISNLSDNIKTDNNKAITKTVLDVLVTQLGYKVPNAQKMIKDVLKQNKLIDTAEKLFDEIYISMDGK